MLLSNASLAPALHVYEKLGFRHAPMPAGSEYVRANVHMTMTLNRQEAHQADRETFLMGDGRSP